jgi:hypothetical protein
MRKPSMCGCSYIYTAGLRICMETTCLCSQTRELELELELSGLAHMDKYEPSERRNGGKIFSSHLR